MTTSTLKLIALLLMLIDHVGEFFPEAPIWLRYFGRVSAPLFFFCSAWGFYYTHDRKKYLLRLYLLGLIMTFGNIIIPIISKKEIEITNNIFVTIFIGCMIIHLIENSKTRLEKIKCIALIIIQQIVAFILCALGAEIIQIPKFIDTHALYYGYGSIFGSAIFTEGSFLFVLFLVGLYYLKKSKIGLSIFTLGFTIITEFAVRRTYYMRGPAEYLIPFNHFQWMMVFVIPFYWMYNGKKGKGRKWLFYIFYPVHIWILYIIS